MPKIVSGPLLVLLLANCGAQAGDDAQTNDAIIGGKVDPADRAVVLFMMDSADGWDACTATFIAPTVLLTAAHCVTTDGDPHRVPSNVSFHVVTSTSDANASHSAYLQVRNANVHPHPDYDGDHYADLAIAVLDHPYDVTPVAIQRGPLPASIVGSTVKLIGYGEHTRNDSPDEPLVRRTVKTQVRAVDSTMVLIGKTGQQACDGDSGGPAILDVHGVPTIIGTDDIASNQIDCTRGDWYQRVDRWLPFIQPYLDAAKSRS